MFRIVNTSPCNKENSITIYSNVRNDIAHIQYAAACGQTPLSQFGEHYFIQSGLEGRMSSIIGGR